MSRIAIASAVGAILWLAWCLLVIEDLVPMLRRHLTMWPWLLAYFFCLLPVVVVALAISLRLRRTE